MLLTPASYGSHSERAAPAYKSNQQMLSVSLERHDGLLEQSSTSTPIVVALLVTATQIHRTCLLWCGAPRCVWPKRARSTGRVSATRISAPRTRGDTFDGSASP